MISSSGSRHRLAKQFKLIAVRLDKLTPYPSFRPTTKNVIMGQNRLAGCRISAASGALGQLSDEPNTCGVLVEVRSGFRYKSALECRPQIRPVVHPVHVLRIDRAR